MEKTRDELAKEYGTGVMSSMFTPMLDDYYRKSIRCGLIFDITWLSGLLETISGKKYIIFRAYQKNSSSKFYAIVMEKDGNPTPLTDPSYKGYIWYDKLPGEEKILIKSYQDDPCKFEMTIEPQKIYWKEGDDIELNYEALAGC